MSSTDDLLKKATALHEQGKFGEAAVIYRNILRDDPKNVLVMHLLALVAMQFDNAPLVLALSEEGLRLAPSIAPLHQDRATALRRLGRKEDALAAIEQAIVLDPKQADFFDTLSSILRDMRFYDRAIAALKTAIAMEPDNAKFHNNLGICLGRVGLNDEALDYFNRYIKLKPDMAEGYNNRANILKSMGRYQEAIMDYDRSLAINPSIFMGKANKGICHLVLGEYAQGWPLFEDRKPGNMPPEAKRFDAAKRWDGTPLDGTLILYNEQGLGDTIQFCRYVPMVEARVKKLILHVQKPLQSWLQENWPHLTIIADSDVLPDYAAQCPLMSLPHIFETLLSSIPSPGPYLGARPDKINAWKEKLPQHDRKRVGLVWAGNPDHMNDHIRSIKLAQLDALWNIPDIHYIALQKGDAALAQIAALPAHARLTAVGDQLHDFSDTAGLLKNIDLLISVDTAVLHAAGALGVPAWGLVQFDPDWRWMIGREDTPWYKTTKLFRQKSFGDWDGVISNIVTALKKDQ